MPRGGKAAAARPGPQPGAPAAWPPPCILYISCMCCMYLYMFGYIWCILGIFPQLSLPRRFLYSFLKKRCWLPAPESSPVSPVVPPASGA